ncbi:MAG TPA: cysteine desulfurase, partial [Clostridiales bacterium]|nr:cysteine desulfurase [Clostridiales bacterium]
PLLRYIGVDSTCRASFAMYNTYKDVDMLINALEKVYNTFKKYIKDN